MLKGAQPCHTLDVCEVLVVLGGVGVEGLLALAYVPALRLIQGGGLGGDETDETDDDDEQDGSAAVELADGVSVHDDDARRRRMTKMRRVSCVTKGARSVLR